MKPQQGIEPRDTLEESPNHLDVDGSSPEEFNEFFLNPSPDDVRCNIFSRGPVSPHIQILFGWIIRSTYAWMCRQDTLWYTKLALLFILRNVLLSLDIFSIVKEQLTVGVKAGVKAGVKTGVKLGVSAITQVVCCSIDIADGLATRGANCLFAR